MNVSNKIPAAMALASVFALSQPGALQAGGDPPVLTMKPFHGISFDVGTKRAVAYFLAGRGTCDLVATFADPPSWNDGAPPFSAQRFEAAIPAGQARRFNAAEGKTLEFACQARAEAMSVKAVEQIAADARPAE